MNVNKAIFKEEDVQDIRFHCPICGKKTLVTTPDGFIKEQLFNKIVCHCLNKNCSEQPFYVTVHMANKPIK